MLDGLELELALVAELEESEELPGGDLFVRSVILWNIRALFRRSMGIGRARATCSALRLSG